MPSAWTETTVTVAAAHAEAVASFLLDLGSPGLTTDESESLVQLTGYLAVDAAASLRELRTLCDELGATTPELPPARIATRRVEQEDWAHAWMDHFPPLCVGDRLYVVPPWVTEVPPGRVSIVIDPGLAFGTGHHATTQGSLVLLERVVHAGRVRRAVDVGTGSGILAIALSKLGVAEVWAVDVDPEARRAARDNGERNGVADRVHIGTALVDGPGRFDLIAANLLSSLLVEMAPALAAALAPAGHAVVSGILDVEAPDVVAAFAARGLHESSRVTGGGAGEWVSLDLVRAPS
jgi:ribosomal protein L11 methyltransferase